MRPPTIARPLRREPSDLGLLFHRLNNQLGIILANAELLEAKAADEMGARARRPGRRQRARRDGDRPRNPPADAIGRPVARFQFPVPGSRLRSQSSTVIDLRPRPSSICAA